MRERGLRGIICFLETLGSQGFFGDHVDFPRKPQELPKQLPKNTCPSQSNTQVGTKFVIFKNSQILSARICPLDLE